MQGSTSCGVFTTIDNTNVEAEETFLVQMTSIDSVDIERGSSIVHIVDNDGKIYCTL